MKKQTNKEIVYCASCGSDLNDGENFCRFCGARRGEVTVFDYEELRQTVYGPPMITDYECEKCHHCFSNRALGQSGVNFCPFCGTDWRSLAVTGSELDDTLLSSFDDDDDDDELDTVILFDDED